MFAVFAAMFAVFAMFAMFACNSIAISHVCEHMFAMFV